MNETEYRYDEVIPIKSYIRTTWMIEEEYPTHKRRFIAVWHGEAKIEDIVMAHKTMKPDVKFTVAALDVGMFEVHLPIHAMSNARKLNQNMCVVV